MIALLGKRTARDRKVRVTIYDCYDVVPESGVRRGPLVAAPSHNQQNETTENQWRARMLHSSIGKEGDYFVNDM